MSLEIPPLPPMLTPQTTTTLEVEHLHNYSTPLQISTLDVPNIITICSIATYAHVGSSRRVVVSAIVDALLVPAALDPLTRATLYKPSELTLGSRPWLSPPTPAEGTRLLCRTYVNCDGLYFTHNEVSMSHRFNPHQFRIILVSHLARQHVDMGVPTLGAKLVITTD